MKYRILAAIVILVALFSINVSAATYEYSISPSDNFITAQHGDNLTEISQKLNMSTDDLSTYFNKNGLVYLAVSDDAKTQIRLSAFTDNFSSAVSDISYLDQTALNEFMSAVSEDGESSCELVTSNGRKYIVVKDTLQDSGGAYTVTQYITICDSKTFYLSCYNEGEDTSDEIHSVFNGFYLKSIETEEGTNTTPLVFIAIGVIIFTCLAIVMIIGIIKKLTAKENKEYEI